MTAGCGGAPSRNLSILAGTYTGTWSNTQGGAVQGSADATINPAGDVTMVLANTATGGPPDNITGKVDAQGNFTGQVATIIRPMSVNGNVQAAQPTGINAFLNEPLTPGRQDPSGRSWYITASAP